MIVVEIVKITTILLLLVPVTCLAVFIQLQSTASHRVDDANIVNHLQSLSVDDCNHDGHACTGIPTFTSMPLSLARM